MKPDSENQIKGSVAGQRFSSAPNAHRDDGNRFVVHADDKRAAFLELERAVGIHLLGEQC